GGVAEGHDRGERLGVELAAAVAFERPLLRDHITVQHVRSSIDSDTHRAGDGGLQILRLGGWVCGKRFHWRISRLVLQTPTGTSSRSISSPANWLACALSH